MNALAAASKRYRQNITAQRPSQAPTASFEEREKGLAQSFAAARGRLKGQEREATRQTEKGLQRLQSRVGAVGGSVEKARGQALKEIQRTAGEAETQLAAQEQAARGQLEAAKTQYDQFKETMQFQKDSFADQMALQWAEFDETQKAQVINAMTALKEAGIRSAKDYANIFGASGGVVREIYGSRAPQTTAAGLYYKAKYREPQRFI